LSEWHREGWENNPLTGVWLYMKDPKKMPKCGICGAELIAVLSWTVRNGVAICQCGAEYTTLHREGQKLLDQEPTCHVPDDLVPRYREAWQASKSKDEYSDKVRAIAHRGILYNSVSEYFIRFQIGILLRV